MFVGLAGGLILYQFVGYARNTAASRAKQSDIGAVERGRKLDALAFLALASRTLMLNEQIQALDHDPAFFDEYLDDLAALAFVFSGDDFDFVSDF